MRFLPRIHSILSKRKLSTLPQSVSVRQVMRQNETGLMEKGHQHYSVRNCFYDLENPAFQPLALISRCFPAISQPVGMNGAQAYHIVLTLLFTAALFLFWL